MTESSFIVDADLHLAETPADLAPHCAMPWRRVLLREDEIPPPWGIGETLYPYLGTRPMAQAAARRVVELEERLATRGVAAGLVLPGPLLKIGLVHRAEYCVALAAAYNRWLIDEWLV